jgi:hypothetical protein
VLSFSEKLKNPEHLKFLHVSSVYHRVHAIIPVTWEAKFRTAGKKQDPISKITRAKRAGAVAQVVECLPCNCEGLSSNLSDKKKKKHKHKGICWLSVN